MKPITIGRYRLRNGRTAIVRKLDTVNDVRIATGCIQDADAERPMEWNGDDGLFGNNPGPWDLVKRLPDAPEESVLNTLRREHAAMMAIADGSVQVGKRALASAQEIEHRIAELERIAR